MTLLTDDEVLYALMSYGVLYNLDKGADLDKKQRKAFKKKKSDTYKHLVLFAFRYQNQAEKAMKRYKSMSDEERSTFYKSFEISENLKKEFKI